jgi:hypothetical protein
MLSAQHVTFNFLLSFNLFDLERFSRRRRTLHQADKSNQVKGIVQKIARVSPNDCSPD